MPGERFKITPAVHLILQKGEKIFLSLRKNTGWHDGEYSLPSGHLEGNETLLEAMTREAKEEIGITVASEDLRLVHVMHRKQSDQERIDFFFSATKWSGEPENKEPEKCGGLGWYEIPSLGVILPIDIIPYVEQAVRQSFGGKFYSEYGWD
ncbi:MAG: NUDIX domain-containing protein [Candidatus Wildermuthbacteria bacterium]|nr:NUDIX domain-containing protein [Candidatus Wildermuthbacteria bacterium]